MALTFSDAYQEKLRILAESYYSGVRLTNSPSPTLEDLRELQALGTIGVNMVKKFYEIDCTTDENTSMLQRDEKKRARGGLIHPLMIPLIYTKAVSPSNPPSPLTTVRPMGHRLGMPNPGVYDSDYTG